MGCGCMVDQGQGLSCGSASGRMPRGNKMDEKSVSPDQNLLTDEERQHILSRAHSVFSWVGNLIPDREKFDNTEIELRNVIFKLRTKKGITDDDRELARLLIGKIKERKSELENKLKNDRITLATAKKLLDEISGLVKAINDLHDVETSDDLFERKVAIMSKVDDEKRWQRYLKRLKMGDLSDSRRRERTCPFASKTGAFCTDRF